MAPIKVLLQSSIPYRPDDWHIGRFSLLGAYLSGLRGLPGVPEVRVVARNREPDASGRDPFLLALSRADFDEVWLLCGDSGDGPTDEECAAIDAFQRAGGGVLTARDHQDMGLWLCNLRGIGGAHHFHAPAHRELDPARWTRDDPHTLSIDFPNYHSGANGDFQRIVPVEPLHPLLVREKDSGQIAYLPSHPHEGAVSAPHGDGRARTVMKGTSKATGTLFDLAVAFERSPEVRGRGLAESSFHHFTDYNWDTALGSPSFVTEPPGTGMRENPRALSDTHAYVRNLVHWLAPADR